jgi:Kef-type K+ transport system membrane component KefB
LKSSGRVAGLLLNYRLSFGIIAASVGLNVGILDERLYAVVLLVIVASAGLPALFLPSGNEDCKFVLGEAS